MLKKIIYLSMFFFIASCSSNKTNSVYLEKINNLEHFLNKKNISGIKAVSKYFIENKQWQHVYKAYQFLCINDANTDLYCALMWVTAQKTQKNAHIFDAAATNYHVKKSKYWLSQLMQVSNTAKQAVIIKLLQNKPLSDIEINSLIDSKAHYANALLIKGENQSHLPSLIEAAAIFITLQQWELAADSYVISSNIALMKNEATKARKYYYEALIYYDLAISPLKIKEVLSWGQLNGFTR